MTNLPTLVTLLRIAASFIGMLLVALALQDAFEVVLLPRRVQRRFRFMHYFFRGTWAGWSKFGGLRPAGLGREGVLAIYGPLSMVLLFTCWLVGLVIGFGLLQWGLANPTASVSLSSYIVMSGRTFFTLGSSITPSHGMLGQSLVIFEAGTGFGFIALMVSYLPVLYQHFSRRDAQIIELDARAGSPPEAATLLIRYATLGNLAGLHTYLRDWEKWAVDLAESHSSYPMLAFYRSQHRNNSWLASLAIMLDVSTLLLVGAEDVDLLQAASSYAAAQKVLVELTQAWDVKATRSMTKDRKGPSDLAQIQAFFQAAGLGWQNSRDASSAIARLRLNYEPMLEGLSAYLLLPLPRWGQLSAIGDPIAHRSLLIQRLVRSEGNVSIHEDGQGHETYESQAPDAANSSKDMH